MKIAFKKKSHGSLKASLNRFYFQYLMFFKVKQDIQQGECYVRSGIEKFKNVCQVFWRWRKLLHFDDRLGRGTDDMIYLEA